MHFLLCCIGWFDMIEYRKGNLLDVTEGIIVHGCNMCGVMGAGVALAVKQKYPACFAKYKLCLETCKYSLGENIMYRVNQNLWICNALTQDDYGGTKRQVNYTAISHVFRDLVTEGSSPLHFPKIGAGLGGGDWGIIEQIINDCDPDDTVQKNCWEL